ncbi:glucose-6-phosphate isomerase [Buchnera aphidicola (Mindarus keteleerifoliae)]|uniref:glucose-6-phosphate isomerase n=1 Tax=Buchnera aphidicola TaxID=9 RepID=UPI0031B6C02A
MKNVDPTKTKSWKKLNKHLKYIKRIHIKELFLDDPNRFENFSIVFNNQMIVDFSKNLITNNTIKLLLSLAKETLVSNAIQEMFSGKIINLTENRAVLHVALRNQSKNPIYVNQENVMLKVNKNLKKMKKFSEKVISGNWKGYTGKSITDIVNIGIGGSHLGPEMVTEALKPYKNDLNVHFLSNVDGTHVAELIKKVNLERTMFIISSKTFSTQETMTNAMTIKEWFVARTNKKSDFQNHFIAVSMNIQSAVEFGIHKNNIFPVWDWVGGRYSLWSSVGLPIILSIGYINFVSLLKGAYEMDQHFLNTEFDRNIPLLLALISIWYNNFFLSETEAILPYDQYMHKFSSYFQQGNMESNGKSIDRNGVPVKWKTGPIIWGESGTNGQHSFYQLIHQGTRLIPCDFIVPAISHNPINDHHIKLMSHFLGQTHALAFGKDNYSKKSNIKNDPFLIFKTFLGNKPTNSILVNKITPFTLGSLIALYEHKIFVQGVIFNIFSFDQWGVELGKESSKKILSKLFHSEKKSFLDSSTLGLIKYYEIFKQK